MELPQTQHGLIQVEPRIKSDCIQDQPLDSIQGKYTCICDTPGLFLGGAQEEVCLRELIAPVYAVTHS